MIRRKKTGRIAIRGVAVAVLLLAVMGIFFAACAAEDGNPQGSLPGESQEIPQGVTPGGSSQESGEVPTGPETDGNPETSGTGSSGTEAVTTPEGSVAPETSIGPETSKKPTTSSEPATSSASTTPANPETSKTPDTSKEPETSKKPDTPKTPLTPEEIDRAARKLLQGMTLEEKIYQLFIVTPEQLCDRKATVTEAGAITEAALKRRPVGGIVYFAGNIVTPEQVSRMIAGQQAFSRLGLFIAVDEEGGRVARLGRNPAMGTATFPPMGEIGAGGDLAAARNVGLTLGRDLLRFGFNLNFAPVADVNSNPDNPVIGDRSFSRDPAMAAKMVAACVSGFRESGVLCTLKHFPGHGDTATDSHYGAAISEKTLSDLQKCEFLPFLSGIDAGADLIMVGHISLPAVTGDDTPATLSYEIVTGILREQLGFSGLIVTDSMSMKAISGRYPAGEAAVKALLAGVDILLMPENLADAAGGILTAVQKGKISEERLEESVYRILSLKLSAGIIPQA